MKLPLAIACLAAPVSAQDSAPRILAERASLPSPPAPAALGSPTPRVLFAAEGDDNANALVVHPDANGNGVPDVVVGWDIFQTGDNLQLFDGGGFGAGSTIWSLVTQDGVSGGYFSGLDQAKVFPDATGDGIDEILTGSSGGGRAATLYDGASGVVLQSFDTYLGADSGWVYDVEPIADVNGNGTADFALATGSMADRVFVVDGGATGVHHGELWHFDGPDAFYSIEVIGDVDGDGVDDLAAATGDFAMTVFGLSGADGGLLWERDLAANVYHLAAYPDANGDGVDEVSCSVWSSAEGVAMLDGATGLPFWTSGVAGAFVMRTTPVDDVTGDGFPEIAVASWDDRAHLLSGASGTAVWSAPATGGDLWAVARVEDVTGDGLGEVAHGSFDGFCRLADGASGATLWAFDANGHKVLNVLAAPDLDGDGQPEVVAGTQQLAFSVEPLAFVLAADSGVPGNGPELVLSGSTALGGTIVLDVAGGAPGDPLLWFLGFQPTLQAAPPVGFQAIAPPVFLAGWPPVVGPAGTAQQTAVLPADPAFVGLELYFQAFEILVAAPGTGRSTNRVGLAIGT